MHGGAEQRVDARFGIIVQDEHVHVVAAREPLDEPEQARHDALAAGAIDAAGDDEPMRMRSKHLTREDTVKSIGCVR